MFLTNETAAPLKLVVILNEQAGVRFVAGYGGVFFATTVCRPILGPTLSQLLITRDKAAADLSFPTVAEVWDAQSRVSIPVACFHIVAKCQHQSSKCTFILRRLV
jgi:hypothetical protein